MAATRDTGSGLLWLDGSPDMGLPNPQTAASVGTELYWLDGAPVVYLFPSDFGRFLLLFN